MSGNRTGPASLYVVCYTTNLVKVGVTRNFDTRLYQHHRRARDLGVSYIRHYVTVPFDDAYLMESHLIEWSRVLGHRFDDHGKSEWVRTENALALASYARDAAAYYDVSRPTCTCGHPYGDHRKKLLLSDNKRCEWYRMFKCGCDGFMHDGGTHTMPYVINAELGKYVRL